MPNGLRYPDVPEPLVPRKNDLLAEICRAIARSGDHRDVVQESTGRLQRYFGAHAVAVFFESEGDLLLEGLAFPDHLSMLTDEVRAAWNVRATNADRPAVQAMSRRESLRWDSEDTSLSGEIQRMLRRLHARVLVVIPIYVDGDPIGACSVATPEEKPLTATDEALFETALGVVGIVYRRGVLKELEAEHQRQAIQAHNLAAVGELAAGVAHEINNPLNTIVHFAEVLLQKNLGSDSSEQVRAILVEALRAAKTVRSLQVFARHERSEARSSVRVEEAIQSIVDLARHQLAVSNVAVRVQTAPDLPAARASEAHLRRVLHNVIANARFAIRRTGAPGEIRVRAELVGRWVEIAVEDTGPGITPEVGAAMFRPFYTTNPTGEGTGLGLAVAYGMVREHGGEIEGGNWGKPAVSGGEPGEGGARLVIRLPADVDPWLPTPEPTAELAEPGRVLSILVVEDEPLVARSLVAQLNHEGHGIELTDSAEAAVERLRTGASFDVILADLRMPGIGGEGLFAWIRAERPQLLDRLLFMSGDLLSSETDDFLESAARPVLAKPFTLAALRSALTPFSRSPISDPRDG